MKANKYTFLLIVLLSILFTPTYAYDIKIANTDGVDICYNWINDNTELEVTSTGISFGANLYSGSIVIPESVEYEGNNYSVTSIGIRAFYKSSVTSVSIPNSVTKICDSAFDYCRTLTSIVIPSSVTYLGQFAFSSCSKLSTITIPDGITEIKASTFYECKKLSSIYFGNGVERIEDGAFYGCESLTSLVIPNTVSYIGFSAFENCSGLQTVTFGNGLKYICTSSFYGNIIMTDVYCLAEEVPEAVTNDYYKIYKMFENTVYNNATLHVPAESVNAYKSAQGWKYFKNIVAIERSKYSLLYILDGEEYKNYNLEEGETITPEPDPVKDGYTFSGWSEIPETMPNHNVTVTGSFSVNKYKLTYMVDGEEYRTFDVEYGSSITPEPVPTKEGYTFSGWSEIPEAMPAHDVTVTGSFTINRYKLVYKIDGEVYKSSDVEYGAAITPEADPEKEGYTFSGWSEIPQTMPAHDVTVTGSFTKGQYKLTYIVDGETYKVLSYDYNTAITPEPAPEKDGYSFSGWSEIPQTMPAHDVTVTGSFTINKYMITYMVNNVELKKEQLEYGATITPPATDNEGHEIMWNSHPTTMPAYDITIYGSVATGIEFISVDNGSAVIFSIEGKQLSKYQKGLNIVKYSNGQIKKAVVK